MSFDPETTRIVRSWLDEGVTELPDRVLDAVLDQVPATAQRRATWWPARRLSTMNTTLKVGLAAVAVVIVVLIGADFFGNSNVGGPGIDSPTPSDEPIPTASPSPSLGAQLPEGPHILTDGEVIAGQVGLPITVTIPAPGWYGEPGEGIIVKNDDPGAPEGAGVIGPFIGDLYVYGDPCRWATTRPDTPATTVDEVVAALAAQGSRDASEPVDITVDGYAGKSITLHVPDDAVFSECDQGTFGSWGLPGTDPAPFRYHQDPGQIDVVWIVDVDGSVTVIDWGYYEATPRAVVDELQAIVESIAFGD